MFEVLEEIKRLIKIRQSSPILEIHSREDAEVQAVTAMLLLEAAYGDEEYVWCEHRSIVLGLSGEPSVSQLRTLIESLRWLTPFVPRTCGWLRQCVS